MTEEKKQQLFPYFAYLFSQEINPEKYGAAESVEEWTNLIQDNPEDIEQIATAAKQLSDEDWEELEAQYAEAQGAEEAQLAKKGAKLKKLQELKKGGKKKRCACGCEMISKKDDIIRYKLCLKKRSFDFYLRKQNLWNYKVIAIKMY